MARKVLVYNLSEPLQSMTPTKVDINTADGNLKIDPLPGEPKLAAGELELACGELEYLENQEPPTRSLTTAGNRTTLTLKSGSKGQPWLRLPWSTCNGATEWRIRLSPGVPLEITARSGGGNIKLDLTGLTITGLEAGTGGGNIEVILPDTLSGLQVTIKSGAGNVTVHLPSGIAAKIHATTGLGKVIMDGPFSQIDKTTYQSPGYDSAVEKIEITAASGAGNVSIKEKIGQPV